MLKSAWDTHFEYEGKKLSYASDVGCVNNIIKENLKNSDVIVLESKL